MTVITTCSGDTVMTVPSGASNIKTVTAVLSGASNIKTVTPVPAGVCNSENVMTVPTGACSGRPAVLAEKRGEFGSNYDKGESCQWRIEVDYDEVGSS